MAIIQKGITMFFIRKHKNNNPKDTGKNIFIKIDKAILTVYFFLQYLHTTIGLCPWEVLKKRFDTMFFTIGAFTVSYII